MEPSLDVFDQCHTTYDEEGDEVPPLSSPHGGFTIDRSPMSSELMRNSAVHSVLLAEGVHYHIEDEELDALPRRFDPGSSKARL